MEMTIKFKLIIALSLLFNLNYAEEVFVCQPECICTVITSESSLPQNLVDCSAVNYKNITKNNYTEVEILDFSYNQIQNLEGLDFLLESDSLIKFVLSHNKISYIVDKYFQLMPNLIELYLDHNELVTLDSFVFSGLEKLKKLDLSYNRLKIFSDYVFKPLNSLQEIYFNYNNLGKVLNVNSISDTNLGLNTNISAMGLAACGIDKISSDYFSIYTRITQLDLSDNNFQEIPAIPEGTENLDLSGNNISMLTARDLNYPFLKKLKLERLNSLRTIDRYAFYNLQSLEHLSLANCPKLQNFEPLAFGVLDREVKLNLKTLSLKGCRLQSINESFQNLFMYMDKVDITFNPWKCDCNILWLKNIRSVLVRDDYVR